MTMFKDAANKVQDWIDYLDDAYDKLSGINPQKESPADVAHQISDASGDVGHVLNQLWDIKKQLEKGGEDA